jgi:hypothetical protein
MLKDGVDKQEDDRSIAPTEMQGTVQSNPEVNQEEQLGEEEEEPEYIPTEDNYDSYFQKNNQ